MQLDPRGQIDMMILAVLGDGEWIYGRALIQELRDRSDGEVDLPEGTAYPALHRLTAAGLLERRDEEQMTAVVHKVTFGLTTEHSHTAAPAMSSTPRPALAH